MIVITKTFVPNEEFDLNIILKDKEDQAKLNIAVLNKWQNYSDNCLQSVSCGFCVAPTNVPT